MMHDLKPYPAYKDSGVLWLDKVPEHWEVLPALAAYKPKLVKNTGMIENTVLSLSYGRIIVKPAEKLHGLIPESFETYQIVDPGDIIVRPTDLQNDHTSLRVGYSETRGIITSAYMCLKTVNRMSSEFGYQFLNTYDLLKIIYGYGSGLRQNLDFSEIKRMPVLVPPCAEQSVIVKFLKTADRQIIRYIAARQRLIKLLEEQKQAIIHDAVTHGLNPNRRLKPSGVEWLGDVPEDWKILALKHAFQSMDYGISESSQDDGSIPVLTMGNIANGRVKIPERGGVNLVEDRLLLEPGDLLFNRTNSAELVGKVGLFEGASSPVTFASYLVRLRPTRYNVPEYLNYVLNGPSILRTARREAIPSLHQSNLNPTRYGRLQIALPPRDEQLEIVRHLKHSISGIEDSINHAHRTNSLLLEYRTRLIADVVTGKLDVRKSTAMPDEVDESDGLVLADEAFQGGELPSDEVADEEVVG